MQVVDLDGNSGEWKVKGKEVTLDKRPRSSLHKTARELLKERFPTYQILEEVGVPVKRGIHLYFDFYLPLRKLAIEVHGQQHYEYNTMFHNSQLDFLKQRRHDRYKEEWCEANGIQLIVLPYNEQDSWKEKL